MTLFCCSLLDTQNTKAKSIQLWNNEIIIQKKMVFSQLTMQILRLWKINYAHSYNVLFPFLLNRIDWVKVLRSTTTILRLLYGSTCVRRHPQLRTGGFDWSQVLLLTFNCWQLRYLLNFSFYIIFENCEKHYDGVNWSRIGYQPWAIDWHHDPWPWTILDLGQDFSIKYLK